MGLFGKKREAAPYGPGRHKLGFGAGVIVESEDGRATYAAPAGQGTAFTVSIADVRSFSVQPSGVALQATLKVLGNGVELVEASVPVAGVEAIQQWFRGHPRFAG